MAIELPRIPYKRKANRRFNYVPKYYDPEKERLQAQIDFHKKKSISKNEDIEQVKRNIRNSFSYNNIGLLSHSDDFPYEFIGFSESGALLEFLSTRLLL